MDHPNRRWLLKAALGACAALGTAPTLAHAVALAPARRLSLDNLHTGERLAAVYWADGAYLPDAARQIDHLLRDFRANEVHPIDPKLLDLLYALTALLPEKSPYEVISGYRSPTTNAMLHAASDGVAAHSLHTQGMAIDVRVPGTVLARLRDQAKSLHGGGVGYYARSDFVHVDVGRVRYW
jgi:uncharacterized protein YcbK (DUF882 family)